MSLNEASSHQESQSVGDLHLESQGTQLMVATDFASCIICQKSGAKLYNVTNASLPTLKRATDARQDDVWTRLSTFLDSETFLTDKSPKWHPGCQNIYLLKSSYTLAEKKRNEATKSECTSKSENEHSLQAAQSITRRSMTLTCWRKNQCIICCKTYQHGKEPTFMVTTKERQLSLQQKAKELNDEALLIRIQGFGDETIDMIAYDVCYHRICMNRYMSRRGSKLPACDMGDIHEETFHHFVQKISEPLLEGSTVFLLTTLRDMYQAMLKEKAVDNWENRLQSHFQDKIVFFPQTKGSDVVCSANLAVGNVLMKLKQIQDDTSRQDDTNLVLAAARIIRKTAKLLKISKTPELDDILDVSRDKAEKFIPDIIYIFASQLLSNKHIEIETPITKNDETALLLAQQLLTSICNIPTPISIGIAFDIYNATRSKTQMIELNRLQQSVSYDTFHRILTSIYNQIITIKEEKGNYIPPNMKHGVFTHFAMDNIDWAEKTSDGSTYHATSSIMIQPPRNDPDSAAAQECTNQQKSQVVSRKQTIDQVEEQNLQVCRLTPGDRRKSRSLEKVTSLASLMTSGPKIGEHLLFLWGLSWMTPTQVLNLEIDETVPGFSAFCAGIGTLHQSNEIGYLPLIPSPPTDPGVVKTAMMNLVRLAETIGMTHTVITCDQAIYEIAYTLKEQYPEEFANVVLMLGGFHLAHNFLKAITKIMRGSGAEDILVAAKVFLQGTANKSFGDRGDYYQSLHGLTILYEVMLRLRWEAIENWCVQNEIDTQCLEHLMETLKDLNTCDSQQELMDLLDRAKPSLYGAENLTSRFREAMDGHPTQKLWSTFLEMVGILLCFICAQHEGNWQDYLEQAGKMLPFLVSAGHYKYGSYLSLHLKEMKDLPQNAPSIYEHFEQGEFTVRQARGKHNGVSPDMALEQTYNVEVKQKQGLCGITLEPKAQTKWLYTKPVVAEVAGKLRRMLHMEPSYDRTPEHHESGTSIVQKDALAVQSCLQVIPTQMVNPFQKLNPDSLVCISNGARASKETRRDLTQLKAIGEKAFLSCLEKGGDKFFVKLNTFDSTHSKQSTGKEKSKVSAEINVLQRISQVIAAGGEVHIEELVGNTNVRTSLLHCSTLTVPYERATSQRW